MVDLGGLALLDRRPQGARIEQVATHQVNLLAQVLGAAERAVGGATHEAADVVPLLQQQLRQERSVLAGEAGDQSLASRGWQLTDTAGAYVAAS